MGVSTVITSGKGGVGKSTVSVGLGRALAQRGRRVLLIDCDAGLRSLDRMTGTEEALVFDLSDVIQGRCAPADAIYPCTETEGLFLLPAPSSGEDMASPSVMRRLVPLLKRYYDHVVLDSPASAVKRLLEKLAVPELRLVINRFNSRLFDETGVYSDLDNVIDASSIRLFGVVPEDYSLAAAFLKGKKAEEHSKGMMALCRIAGRLDGETIPLSVF